MLAVLRPDPQRAPAVVTAAGRARDAARSARTGLAHRTSQPDRTAGDLITQGLSPRQVQDLPGLTKDEDPLATRHAAHPAAARPE